MLKQSSQDPSNGHARTYDRNAREEWQNYARIEQVSILNVDYLAMF